MKSPFFWVQSPFSYDFPMIFLRFSQFRGPRNPASAQTNRCWARGFPDRSSQVIQTSAIGSQGGAPAWNR